MNLTCKTATPEPNRQFILDLQSWIQDLHENGHQVILNLDNNEDLYASDGRVQLSLIAPMMLHPALLRMGP